MKLAATLKPRADAADLSRHVQAAWQAYQAAMFPDHETAAIGEAVAVHLEGLAPADDLATLARYGFTETVTECTVTIYNPASKSWDTHRRVTLPRPVNIPQSRDRANACGPVYDESNCWGHHSHLWAEMGEAHRQEAIDYHTATNKSNLPAACNPYFAKIVEARAVFAAEYRQATEWPAEFKMQNGRYPTWAEIADRFPVLGAYLRGLED